MKAIELYDLTDNCLRQLAKARGLTRLEKYYSQTDQKTPWYQHFKGLGQMNVVFAQLAFHVQNAQRIGGLINWKNNWKLIGQTTKDFDPEKFSASFSSQAEDQMVNEIVRRLRTSLKWKSEGNKDVLARRYARALLRGAIYLKQFKTKSEVVQDLQKHVQKNGKYFKVRGKPVFDQNRYLIQYFIEEMQKPADGAKGKKEKSGFSVALTCNFLKELDPAFEFLGKPDVHLKDVMGKFGGKTYKNNYECLRDFQTTVGQVNGGLKARGQKEITAYRLDRMIWLVCSGKFFLDENYGEKDSYLRRII